MKLSQLDLKSDQNKQEDFEIVSKILAGDTSLFVILEKKYKRIIVALIRKMIHNEDDVQDLTQETFIKAYNALSKFRFGYTFSSWLYKIASNSCIDFMRKKRFQTVPLYTQRPGEEEQELEIPDNYYNPDVTVLAEERKQVLMNAIEQLPENYKMIIRLRHDEDLDYSDIALKLNIPLGTVKAHLFRARKILLEQLKGKKYLFVEN